MSTSQPPLLENATRDLAAFASAIRFEDLQAEVIERIKLSVLDISARARHRRLAGWRTADI